MPTFEEFKNLVKEHFRWYYNDLSEKEIDGYINSEDSRQAIQSEYNWSVKQFKIGEITETIFRNGSVSVAGHCLYMLY